jgi:hypothetical protein
MHEVISIWLKTKLYPENVYIVHDFINRYTAEPVEVEPEEPYVSNKYGYQGTFDWVEREPISGFLVMADLKITGQMYKEYGLQLAAYAQLWNEKHEEKINNGRIYRIDKKTGKVQIKDFPNLKPYWKVFKCLIPVAKWVKGE